MNPLLRQLDRVRPLSASAQDRTTAAFGGRVQQAAPVPTPTRASAAGAATPSPAAGAEADAQVMSPAAGVPATTRKAVSAATPTALTPSQTEPTKRY